MRQFYLLYYFVLLESNFLALSYFDADEEFKFTGEKILNATDFILKVIQTQERDIKVQVDNKLLQIYSQLNKRMALKPI